MAEPGLESQRAEIVARQAELNLMAQVLQTHKSALDKREAAVRGREDMSDARANDERGPRVDASALQTQNDQMREANEKLVLATLTSRELRDAAQTARRRQDEFLAMLAHELRNPLGPIRTSVELLERVKEGQPVPRPVVAVIQRQVEHLVRLLEDLLDVARVTQGKVTLERRPIAVSEFLQRAVEATEGLIKDRQQHLTVDLPEPSLYVDHHVVKPADPEALLRLIDSAMYGAETVPGRGRVPRTDRREKRS